METIADYGTVAYFNVRTFSTGIYQAWFNMQDRAAAAQLALCLLGFALLVAGFERIQRGQARSHLRGGAARRHRAAAARRRAPAGRQPALPAAGHRGASCCPRPCSRAWPTARARASPTRATALRAHSLELAGIAAAVTVAGAVLVGFRARMRPGPRGAGAPARRRARLRGAGRGDRGGPAGALCRARQRHRRLGAAASRHLDRAALHRLDLAAGARLHGPLHGGRAQRLRRRPRHRQPAHRRGRPHPRARAAGAARRGCICRS